jgi:outer membrane immunogenic protein
MVGCTKLMGVFMRKLFWLGMGVFAAVMLGGAAQAADMPLKAPPPAAPIMYNWTGVYIGAHIGGAWFNGNGHDRFDRDFDNCITNTTTICFDDGGFGRNRGRFIGGGQIGYNYQVGQYVWGIEGQISGVASNNDDQACGFFTDTAGVRDFLFRCRDRSGWIATIAGRLGVAFGQTGNWLLYVKGGGAFADANIGLRFRDDCAAVPTVAIICSSSTGVAFNNNNNTRTGWMVGVGLEYGAWGNWSWKLEYNFMDFGHRDLRFDNAFIVDGCPTVGCRLVHDLDFDRQINVVKFGLNYRFGAAAAPVAARY